MCIALPRLAQAFPLLRGTKVVLKSLSNMNAVNPSLIIRQAWPDSMLPVQVLVENKLLENQITPVEFLAAGLFFLQSAFFPSGVNTQSVTFLLL